MSFEEELFNRLTTGQGKSDARYLDTLSERGAATPAENEYLRTVMANNTVMPQNDLAGRGVDTPQEREFLRSAIAQGGAQPASPTVGNMMMTPAEVEAYKQSFADEGINLNPMGGLISTAQNVDRAITNATTAPGILGDASLGNIARGNAYNTSGQVNPYGLGLGQPMYINPDQLGLLKY